MPMIALGILSLAAGFGCYVALPLLDKTRRRSAWIAAIHGMLGLCALAALVVALQGPARGVATGVANFGAAAAALLAIAAVLGLTLPLVSRGLVGLLAGIHAGAAITACLLVMAWTALG